MPVVVLHQRASEMRGRGPGTSAALTPIVTRPVTRASPTIAGNRTKWRGEGGMQVVDVETAEVRELLVD